MVTYPMTDNGPQREQGNTQDDDQVSHDEYMAYMAALQTEALMRLYDTNLVLLSKLTGNYDLANSIIEMHAEGRYYFPPPAIPPNPQP